MKKQYDLKKLRVTRRGAVAKPTSKVQKTIRLDLDVLTWLFKEGDRRGLPYQTLINSTLKEAMLRSEAGSTSGDLQRMVVRQVHRAGAEPDPRGGVDQRGDEGGAVGDGLGAVGDVLADIGLGETKRLGHHDRGAVLLQGRGVVALDRVQRHGEVGVIHDAPHLFMPRARRPGDSQADRSAAGKSFGVTAAGWRG